MSLSITGIAYLILFSGIGLLAYRFFQYWQKSKDITSRYFFYFTISFTIFTLVRGITALFFADNTEVLIASAIFVTFIEGLAAALVAYLITYLKFSRISPKIGFYTILFLGLVTTILYAVLKPAHPYLEATGAINWGFSPAAGPYLYFYILRLGLNLITLTPLLVILIQQFRASDIFYQKMRALGLSSVIFFGIIIALLDFLLIEVLGLRAIIRDIVTSIMGISLFAIIFLTQKPPSQIKS